MLESLGPTMAPTEDAYDWRAAQQRRAINRVIFVGILVFALILRVLVAYAVSWRERRREEQEAAENEKREHQQRVELIQNNLRTVKYETFSLSTHLSRESNDGISNKMDEDDDTSHSSDDKDPLQSCSICFLKFNKEEVVCQSNDSACQHIYHKECMESWLLKHDQCPICRRPYLALPVDEDRQNTESQDGDTSPA